MKSLRFLIVLDALALVAIGTAMFLGPRADLTAQEAEALLRFLGAALAGSALLLMKQSRLALVSEMRNFAKWLGVLTALLWLMLLLVQPKIGLGSSGVDLILLLFALALIWEGRRPMRPEETEAELASLRIPDEIRAAVLRQVGEAAAQEERNRLARDLHDSIKQQLFTINVSAAAAQERWERDPAGARTALVDVRRSAREAMVEMQALLHQLRPQALGSIAGLSAALQEQCEALTYRSGAEVTVELGPEIPEDRLPPGSPEALFRAAQEGLANVARHARAGRVRLWLGREEDRALLRIEDDGQGFEPGAEATGMGLRNLRERAESLGGELEIASEPGLGTRLTIRIPLAAPPAPERPANATRREAWDALQQIAWISGFLVLTHLPSFHYSEYLWYLFIGVTVLSAWPRWRRRLRHNPYADGLLFQLFFIGWLWGLAFDFLDLHEVEGWVMLGFLIFVTFRAAVDLVKFHRASELRRFWRQGDRIWLGLLLVVEAEILLLLALSLSKPEWLPRNPFEILPLLAAGAGFVYFVSRRPRPEEAPV